MPPTPRWRLLGAPLLGPPPEDGLREAARLPETAPAYLGLFLAVHEGRHHEPITREALAALMWPALPEARAQHNLRVAIHRLRSLLAAHGQAQALVAERRRVRLAVTSDLADFESAVARGAWLCAAALPAGPLVEGVGFVTYPALADRIEVEREAVRRAWRRAIVEAAASAAADAAVIEAAAERYLSASAADLEIGALLAQRLAARGQAQAAAALIEALRRAAAEEDALPPAEIDATLRRAWPAAPDLTAGPVALTGRAAELDALDAVQATSRWVTVTGLPGVGKSAFVEAWRTRSPAPGRWALVRVHAGSTAASLAEALLAALPPAGGAAAAPAGPRDARTALAAVHGGVVIDAADEAIDANVMPLLSHLAQACPGVAVVATSRRPLGVAGECLYRLEGLATEVAPGERASPAAMLFLHARRRVVAPGAAAGDGAAAERIARAVQGLPLALKLAAARTRWQSADAIAEALESAAAGTPAAHRARGDASLSALVVAPLLDRLPPPQRAAIAALACFPAAFGMPSAVAVAAVAEAEVEALAALGLLDIDGDTQPPTLRLHALVRAAGLAALAASPAGRREAARRFIGDVIERLDVQRSEHGQPRITHAQAGRCLDDLLAAWPLALEARALEALPVLVQAIAAWHEGAGDPRAGERLLALAVPQLDAEQPEEAAPLARVHVARATLLHRAGDHDAAEALAREGLALAEATGQRRCVRMALNVIGLSCWMLVRLDEAQRSFEHGLASAREDGEAHGEAIFASNLALVAKGRGDYTAAEAAWRRAIEIDRAEGLWWGAATCLNNLGNLLRHLRRFDECEAVVQEGLRLTHEHGLEAARPFALVGIALLRLAQGRHEECRGYLGLIDAIDAARVDLVVREGVLEVRAQLALAEGRADEAAAHIEGALAAARDAGDAMNGAEALALHGRWLAEAAGRPAEAIELWRALRQHPRCHATLRDDLHACLLAIGGEAAGAPVTAADARDLTLVTERLLAAAGRTGPPAGGS
jgi:DNA-binding SARP family transcriptional activator